MSRRIVGDIYGEGLKHFPGKGKKLRSITVEGDKVVAYALGADDIAFTKADVKSLELISGGVLYKDAPGTGGKLAHMNVYRITFTNGDVGTMRLHVNLEVDVMMILR